MILVGALLLDAALGEPRWLWSRIPHPAILMGRAIGGCDAAFNHGAYRRLKGTLTLATLVLAAFLIGMALQALGPLPTLIAAAILLAHRSLVSHVAHVATALRHSTADGRRAVAMIVGRDTRDMDPNAIARAAIESAAENVSDGVVAPAFWFVVAGLPGLLAYKLVNTADSMIGYRTPRHADFGWAAARLDDALNWIPARLTAALIALTHPRPDIRAIIARDAKLHRSPNAGWPEAAMAVALDVALAGPRSYEGHLQEFPFVHPQGSRDAHADDVIAATRVLWRVWVALLALAILIALL